jgi:hypothetical protein
VTERCDCGGEQVGGVRLTVSAGRLDVFSQARFLGATATNGVVWSRQACRGEEFRYIALLKANRDALLEHFGQAWLDEYLAQSEWELTCWAEALRLQMPTVPALADCYAANTHKLEHWCQAVQEAPDGTPMLLIDADTAILQPLVHVWERRFDVALTVKPKPPARFPLNAGVIFLRASLLTKAFMQGWLDGNACLLANQREHQQWKGRFGGINQAALGRWLDRPSEPNTLNIHRLSCAEWNCEDDSWATFDPQVTRILHVKSDLRRAVFSGPKQAARGPHARLAKLWLDLEQQAHAGEAVTA